MIIQAAALGSPWKRGAAAFLICNSLSIFFIWMAFDIAGKPEKFTGWLWLAVLTISAIAYLFGLIFQVARLKYVTLILGFFVAVPIFLLSSVSFFVFFALSEYYWSTKITMAAIYIGVILIWGIINFSKIVKLEKQEKYLAGGVFIENSNAYFSPDNYHELSDHSSAPQEKFTMKKIFSITFPISLLGFPLQRYITDTGGHAATFAFISVLSVPLSVYIAGKIFSGYCLWIYLGGEFERKNGVRIFLRS